MKRLTLITALALATVVFIPAPPTHGAAGLSVPITGSGSGLTFVGTFNLEKFVKTQDGIGVIGTLTGTVTDALGVVTSVVKTITLPVFIGTTTCEILHLDIGPISLDLLGLQVDLSRIVLDITAEAGSGNLLGNLLCAVAGLLDHPSALVRTLNQILGILIG
jgi:hypothetical protein